MSISYTPTTEHLCMILTRPTRADQQETWQLQPCFQENRITCISYSQFRYLESPDYDVRNQTMARWVSQGCTVETGKASTAAVS
jgi:hypothetical protein